MNSGLELVFLNCSEELINMSNRQDCVEGRVRQHE